MIPVTKHCCVNINVTVFIHCIIGGVSTASEEAVSRTMTIAFESLLCRLHPGSPLLRPQKTMMVNALIGLKMAPWLGVAVPRIVVSSSSLIRGSTL